MSKTVPTYVKSKEKLLNVPTNIKIAMSDYLKYNDYAIELRNDITERFDYPSLWAGIDRLIDFIEEKTKAFEQMNAAGYTTDDAIALRIYNKNN